MKQWEVRLSKLRKMKARDGAMRNYGSFFSSASDVLSDA